MKEVVKKENATKINVIEKQPKKHENDNEVVPKPNEDSKQDFTFWSPLMVYCLFSMLWEKYSPSRLSNPLSLLHWTKRNEQKAE